MGEVVWHLESVTLRGGRAARLAGLTLDIMTGVTAVVGCSGAGKTSLLNLLVGFEKPDQGTVNFSRPDGDASLPVYWVPQNAGLWSHLTVREHLAAVMPGRRSEERMAELLRTMGLEERASAHPDDLSMGERSRVAIARALLADASVLVMDEPLAHVDGPAAARCWEVVRAHVQRTATSLVFATHSPETVMGEADRVVCLRAGRLLYDGDVEELYDRPPTREHARLLGEANWMEAEEALRWLGTSGNGRRCYRPERLGIAPADDGPFTVRAWRSRGATAETELLDERTGETRRIVHRHNGRSFRQGDRVVVRLLLGLLLVLAAGCGGKSDPVLAVNQVRHWPVPSHGASVPQVRSVAAGPEGTVLALDTAGRVLVFDREGRVVKSWQLPDVSAGRPEGICLLHDGRVAVCDTHYYRVLLFNMDGDIVDEWGRYGRDPGQFIYPVGITQDAEGCVYVCEYGSNDRIQKFAADGELLASFGSFGTGEDQFQRPSGLAWRDGELYVADAINNRISVFSDEGVWLRNLADGSPGQAALHFPYGVVAGPDGGLYVVEYGAGRISRLNPSGELEGRFGRPGTGPGEFRTPWGLASVDSGRLVVADAMNRRIVELTF
jgi:iron(III) transport system ATP-binding protein